MRHERQLQAREVIACGQGSDFCLFRLPHELTMRAHQAADRRVGEDRSVVGLPAEQAGDRAKGQLLGQQASPFLEATRDDDAIVPGKDSVAGDHMGLRLRMRTDLAGERQGAEATGDGDGFVPVSVDRLRGKKTGGAALSAQHR